MYICCGEKNKNLLATCTPMIQENIFRCLNGRVSEIIYLLVNKDSFIVIQTEMLFNKTYVCRLCEISKPS